MAFERRHIRSWAALADDFNPIHFDAAAARRLGFEGIVVHGMLPLLHIKRALSTTETAACGDDWTTISCRFRQPVAKGLSHRLEITPHRKGRRFSLRRDGDGRETIAGMATTVAMRENAKPGVASFAIETEVVRRKKAIFERAFPGFEDAWLLLDSIVFSQFLSNGVPFALAKEAGGFGSAADPRELMTRVLTVQISHTVSIAPELRSLTVTGFDPLQRIECDIPPLITTDGLGGESLAGVCPIDVRVGGSFVMHSEVGVLFRLGQFQPTPKEES